MKKIITLVGTSLFENFFKKNSDNANLNRYNELKKTENSPYYLWNEQQTRIDPIQKKFTEQDMVSSAEISSIQSIQKQLEEEGISKDKIYVHLIATDTILSVLAAQIIKPKLKSLGINTQFEQPEFPFGNQSESKHVIKDLRISSQDEFQRGMMNLLSVLNTITDSNTILNITGGYKAVVPILTIWAQIAEKDISVKYLFNESELSTAIEPLTIGQLPINFDWEVVEALKPILSADFLCNLYPLASLIEKRKVKYSDNIFKSINETDTETVDILNKIHREKRKAVNVLINYQLIRAENDRFVLTPIGKIIKERTNVGDEKGQIIEHLLFKYFYHQQNQELFDGYSASKPIQNLPKAFISKDISIEIFKDYKEGRRKIGDCDVALTKDKGNTFVWVESKAFKIASSFNENDNKYYTQLKARAIAAKSSDEYENIEILYLVFRFVFKKVNDEANFLDNDSFKAQLQNLQKINLDPEIREFTSFRCVGITIPLEFRGDKINFDPFHKAEFKKWKFEELKIQLT